jgi:hypothetical protein
VLALGTARAKGREPQTVDTARRHRDKSQFFQPFLSAQHIQVEMVQAYCGKSTAFEILAGIPNPRFGLGNPQENLHGKGPLH